MEITKTQPERPRTAPDDAWSREFVRLYRKWYRSIVSLCRRCAGPSVDAEAVAQEAFTRAWLAWGRFSPDRPFGPWIATIARRLCIDHRARMERQADTLHAAAALSGPHVVHSTEDIAAAMDTAAVADAILRTLPARQRQMLELREIEGWSYEQISQVTGTSIEGVRGTLRRARRSFKAAYEQIGSSLGGFGVVIGGLRDAIRRWTWPHAEPVATVSRWAPVELMGVLVPLALALGTMPQTSGSALPAAASVSTTTTAASASTPTIASTTTVPSRQDSALPATAAVSVAEPVGPPVAAAPSPSGISGSVTSIAVSPSYQDDHTVYASGASKCGLPPGSCPPVLYRSIDGGATWELLPAFGRTPGQVMLPPAYPLDRRIFSAGLSELQVSEDDGNTFRTLALTHGVAAMSPQFSNGDPRIFFGRGPTDIFVGAGMEYHDGVGLKPLSLSLPPGASPEHFAFSETYAVDGVVLIGGTYLAPGTTVPNSVAFECVRYECRLHNLDIVLGSPRVVGRSPVHPTALAATAFRLFRSPTEGAAFASIDYPGSRDHRQVIEDVVRLADGTLLLSVHVDQVNRRGRLYSSSDSGDTWTAVSSDEHAAFGNLVQLPDGRLLGAGVFDTGLFCSLDAGRTWKPTCS